MRRSARGAGDRANSGRTYGRDAFAVLSGASLDDREGLSDGQVRPRVPEEPPTSITTAGSAWSAPAAGEQESVRHRPRRESLVATFLMAEVVWIGGANVAECAPITTNYVWQARENGAKVIVVDPRITPIARTCDLFLPVKPGRDVALFNGILHLMIENDWLDHDVHRRAHGRLRASRRARQAVDAATDGRSHRHRRAGDPPGGRDVGDGEDQLPDARPRDRAPLARRAKRAWARSTSCWRRAASAAPGCGYATITGQGNGQGGREHGQKCDQLPGGRDIENPEHRAYIADVWGSRRTSCRGRAWMPTRSSARSIAARSGAA